MARTGVLLQGYGGPKTVADVGPFMTNLMGRVPSPELTARIASHYEAIGGGSPLLEIAENIGRELEERLTALGYDIPVRVGMRYWEPYIADTVGELAAAYSAADIAFVGGSLVPKGGHNILEPALYGVPVIAGPHMQNFGEIAALFSDAGAMTTVADPAGLAETLARWAADPSGYAATGRKGRELLDAFGGAAERNADIVLSGMRRPGGTRR